MAFFFTYTAAILAILFACVAAVLLWKGKKDQLTKIFCLYLISSSVWIGANAAADVAHTEGTLILTSGITFVGGTFLVTFFLIFVDTFIDRKLPSDTRLILYILPSILFTIVSFSEFAIVGTAFPSNAPAQIIPGPQYYLGLIWFVGSLMYGLIRLAKELRHSYGTRYLQTLYILIGFSGLLLGGIIFSVLLPLLGELRFYNVAPQFSLIFAVASGYAILRHKLLDIRFIVQRGLIYSVLFVFIILLYLTVINVLGFFVHQITETTLILSGIAVTLLGIFSVPQIDQFLRRKTDAFFFKGSYDYASTLYSLSERINKSLFAEDIKALTEEALKDILRASSVTISMDGHRHVKDLELPDKGDRQRLTIPITFHDQVVAMLNVGEKRSGDDYTMEDIVLIKTFANQVASAFEKARLYQEIESYSKELEHRVMERTEEIHKLQEYQSQMMLEISHKLQNPLTILKNDLDVLRKSIPNKDKLNFFEKTIDDTSAFIYDLLRLARFEAPRDGERSYQNLSEFVTEMAEYFEMMITQQHMDFESRIDVDIYFSFNRSEITELLTNLVSNAIKYTDVSKEDRKIVLSLLRKDEHIQLSVADNGIGIKREALPHIFDKFYRTSNVQDTSIKGTGLGLAICKRIVELHEGSITAESTEKLGTTFIARFPI